MRLFTKYVRVAKWSEIYTDVGDYFKLVRRAWRLNSRQRELGGRIRITYNYDDSDKSGITAPVACMHSIKNYVEPSVVPGANTKRFTKYQNCSDYFAHRACENRLCPMSNINAKYFQVRRQYINVRDMRNTFWGTRMAQRVRR